MTAPLSPLIWLTSAQKQRFISQGYIVLRNVIPREIVEQAHDFITDAYVGERFERKGVTLAGYDEPLPTFHGDVKKDKAVTGLIFRSGLAHSLDQLLGPGNAIVRWNAGQVAYTPTRRPQPALAGTLDAGRNSSVNSTGWHIDSGGGKSACVASAFMCLVGVAVSPGQEVDEPRGQFCVWPASHLITHRTLSDVIRTTRAEHVMETFRGKSTSLQLGEPQRLLLGRGDAFIAHQRLAHGPSVNECSTPRVNVYFRILHKSQDALVDRYIRSPRPFTGFHGLATELPRSDVHGSPAGGNSNENGTVNGSTVMPPTYKAYSAVGVTAGLSPDHKVVKALTLTAGMRQAFRRDGYVIIRDVVPEAVVREAHDFIEQLYQDGMYTRVKPILDNGYMGVSVQMFKTLQRRREIMDAFYRSGAVDVCEGLLGRGRVLISPNRATVLYCPSETNRGMGGGDGGDGGRDEEKESWGVTPPVASFDMPEEDCALHVYMPLTDFGATQIQHQEQLLLWPGGHFKVQRAFADIVNEKDEKKKEVMRQRWKQTMGEVNSEGRVAAKVNAGDLVMYHSRLPMGIPRNGSSVAKLAVQIRVVHTETEQLLKEKISGTDPFVGLHI